MPAGGTRLLSGLTDSHAHLDLCQDAGRAATSAADNGVSHIVTVGTNLDSSRRAVEFAAKYPHVLASVGIHPHDAGAADEKSLKELSRLAQMPKVVAIGETGLDFYRNRSSRSAQIEAFTGQIELARRTSRTLMVHSRDAEALTLDILKDSAAGLTVIVHCFSLYDHVEECARRGYYMSIAGNVTFDKAKALRRAVTSIPSNLILTETDSPYLSPVPRRGRPNQPANIRFIVNELALLIGVTADELALQIRENFYSAFNLAPLQK